MLKLEQGGTITYKGRPVGRHQHQAGRDVVRINLEYETSAEEDWILPLSYLAIGLNKLEPPPPPIVLEVRGEEEDVAYLPNVTRLLPEKVIKSSGHVWKFHKNDADDWPSPLHGHDYEQGLKLDAITGEIFDVATRQKCATLKPKRLKKIQSELRKCKDLSELAAKHLAEPSDSAADDAGGSNGPAAE